MLVLQPAVESFFLVHGTEKEEKPFTADDKDKEKNNDTSRDTLQSSSSFDVPPSPGPYSPGSSASPSSSRNLLQSGSYSNLPPDTQKFLRFAGKKKNSILLTRYNGISLLSWYRIILVFKSQICIKYLSIKVGSSSCIDVSQDLYKHRDKKECGPSEMGKK